MEEVSWFESVCAELNTNPQSATHKLTVFRESDRAFSVSLYILSASVDPNVQFHTLSVLQHSFIKQWDFLQQTDKETLKNTLWTMILSPNSVSAVSNKLFQAFALVWKRGWSTSTQPDCLKLFESISGYSMYMPNI